MSNIFLGLAPDPHSKGRGGKGRRGRGGRGRVERRGEGSIPE
jgi:hypothetical protein